MSQRRVARILNDLVHAGLVDRAPAGSASLFFLNRDHVAASPVEALASLRAQLWSRMAERAQAWTSPPDAIVVYGSTARGDGDTASDIDLLVIRPDDVDEHDPSWHRDLSDLAARVTRWTGNPCEVLDRSVGQLRSMAADGESLLAEIRRDGRAVVGSVALVPSPAAA